MEETGGGGKEGEKHLLLPHPNGEKALSHLAVFHVSFLENYSCFFRERRVYFGSVHRISKESVMLHFNLSLGRRGREERKGSFFFPSPVKFSYKGL